LPAGSRWPGTAWARTRKQLHGSVRERGTGGRWLTVKLLRGSCLLLLLFSTETALFLSLFLLISQNSKMIGLKKSWSSTRAHHLCLRDHHQKITGFKDFEFRRWAL